MKKAIERVTDVLKGVSTLDIVIRNLAIILLLVIIIIALVGTSRGGHSTLDIVDPSFNPQIQTLALSCKSVDQIVPLPDGRLLVAGTFNTYNGQPVSSGLVRLNANGTLDTTFNYNLSGGVVNIILQADGKILVKNSFYGIIRLNADGSVDTTFNAPSQAVRLLAIDAGGRIIVGGSFFIGGDNRRIARLNSNGSLDSTFQSALGSVQVNALAAQNNKIIVEEYNNGAPSAIRRLNEDGTFDSSFITRNFLGFTRSMIVQPDGKILVQNSFELRRLNQDGSDDTGFTTSPSEVMALSNDGKITIAIVTDYPNYTIKRLLPDGTADGSFTPYAAVRLSTLAVQADGGVLIGDLGSCSGSQITNDFVRLFSNGSLDPTFDTGTGFQTFAPSNVRAINVQPDGKILVGGEFQFVNNVPRMKIARVNPDSTVDTSFQINTSGTGNYFSSVGEFSHIRTQSDGKIVVTGAFSYRIGFDGYDNLVRLNSDGSIDPTFLPYTWFNSSRSFETYTDGKLMFGRNRDSDGTYPAPVKLLATGLPDDTFNPDLYLGTNLVINDLEIQPDGKIIVGGRFSHTSQYSFLTRVNTDGSLDTTFQPREQFDKEVRAFVLQPNGKIVIAETTREEVTPSQTSVLRLNADGSVDPTFNAGTGADGKINTMLLLTTGRIFVGGQFSTFNGQPRGNLVQLNADGSVFTPVYDLNDKVLSLAVDGTGRVFVGGNFTTVIAGNSSAPRSYVAALIDEFPSSTRFDFDGDGRADLGVFSAADGMWSIRSSLNYQTVAARFGLSGDKTVAADYDGDLRTDYAVFRPSNGTWYVKQSTNPNPNAFLAVRWGAAEDKPVTGDFDGDGRADLAVWRPSTGVWWILQSSNGAAAVVKFGLTGDVPLSHVDFDGDRRADIAVWRPSDGHFYWLASGSGNQFKAVHFGQHGDIPAAADYNGDGKADLVVFRPSEGNWYQYLTTPNGGYTFAVIRFGLNQDEPVAADYDGDGRADIAVRRGSQWHILNFAQVYSVQTFGDANARAVASFSIQ